MVKSVFLKLSINIISLLMKNQKLELPEQTPLGSVGELAPCGGDLRLIGDEKQEGIGQIHPTLFLPFRNYPMVSFLLAALLGSLNAQGMCLLRDLLHRSAACPEIVERMVTHYRALPCVFFFSFLFFFSLSGPWACTSQINHHHFNPCLRLCFLEDPCEDITISHYLK